eukprot:jgi/Chrzof1/5420/Cz16g02110.t1
MATFQVSKGVLRPLLESTFGGAACQLPYHDAVRTVYNTCLKQQRCMFCSSIGTDKAGSQQPSEATAQQSQPASSTASNNSNGDMVQGSNSPGDDTIIVPVQPPTPYQSASGYQETHFATDKQGNPLQDQLKVTLRAVERRQRQSTSQDVYELSRSLLEPGADNTSGEAAGKLDAQSKKTLQKLVGVLTKEGKKSRAQNVLIDAMHIIKQELRKNQQGSGHSSAK